MVEHIRDDLQARRCAQYLHWSPPLNAVQGRVSSAEVARIHGALGVPYRGLITNHPM